MKARLQGVRKMQREVFKRMQRVTAEPMIPVFVREAEMIVDAAKKRAPYDPTSEGPHIRDSLRVAVNRRPKQRRAMEVLAGVGRIGRGRQLNRKGIAIEFGVEGQKGQPFLEPAFRRMRRGIRRRLKQAVKNRVER